MTGPVHPSMPRSKVEVHRFKMFGPETVTEQPPTVEDVLHVLLPKLEEVPPRPMTGSEVRRPCVAPPLNPYQFTVSSGPGGGGPVGGEVPVTDGVLATLLPEDHHHAVVVLRQLLFRGVETHQVVAVHVVLP